jgi:hypothetical protein
MFTHQSSVASQENRILMYRGNQNLKSLLLFLAYHCSTYFKFRGIDFPETFD